MIMTKLKILTYTYTTIYLCNVVLYAHTYRSLNDLSQFHPKGGKAVRRSTGSFSGGNKHATGRGGSGGGDRRRSSGSFSSSGGKKKGGKPNRPGKEARSQKRKSNSSA